MKTWMAYRTEVGGNEKLQKIKDLADELEVDLVTINEPQMRIGHKMNRNGLSQMINDGETEIRSVLGGNVHEKGGSKVQQGGTCMLLYGSLIDQYDFEASGKDAMSRLGLSADTIHIRQGGKATKSSYQPHRRYFIRREKDRTCLRRTRFTYIGRI